MARPKITNAVYESLDANTNKISNAGDPTDPQDLATKKYVDDNERTTTFHDTVWTAGAGMSYNAGDVVFFDNSLFVSRTTHTQPSNQLTPFTDSTNWSLAYAGMIDVDNLATLEFLTTSTSNLFIGQWVVLVNDTTTPANNGIWEILTHDTNGTTAKQIIRIGGGGGTDVSFKGTVQSDINIIDDTTDTSLIRGVTWGLNSSGELSGSVSVSGLVGGGGALTVVTDNASGVAVSIPAGGIAIVNATTQYYNTTSAAISVSAVASVADAITFFTTGTDWVRVGDGGGTSAFSDITGNIALTQFPLGEDTAGRVLKSTTTEGVVVWADDTDTQNTIKTSITDADINIEDEVPSVGAVVNFVDNSFVREGTDAVQYWNVAGLPNGGPAFSDAGATVEEQLEFSDFRTRDTFIPSFSVDINPIVDTVAFSINNTGDAVDTVNNGDWTVAVENRYKVIFTKNGQTVVKTLLKGDGSGSVASTELFCLAYDPMNDTWEHSY